MGAEVGVADGATVGAVVGIEFGAAVGIEVGAAVGIEVGAAVGVLVVGSQSLLVCTNPHGYTPFIYSDTSSMVRAPGLDKHAPMQPVLAVLAP